MDYYMGIDAGGTKTEAVLADSQGHILRHIFRHGCNPMDVGIEPCQAGILAVAKELLASAPRTPLSLYGGIAGLDRIDAGMDGFLRRHLPVERIRTEDDGLMLISGMLGHADGCGMVCGTGSSLFARVEGKPPVHIGGLGYLIDTGGSGFELARDALKAAFRYLDGRGEKTLLAERLEQRLQKPLRNAFADIYRGGRAFIASLVPVVFACAEEGDPVSAALLEEGAFRLAELTFAAARHFPGRFPVVMNGGIFHAYPSYARMVREKASERAQMIPADVPAVYGALVEALWQDGRAATRETKETFLAEYDLAGEKEGREG